MSGQLDTPGSLPKIRAQQFVGGRAYSEAGVNLCRRHDFPNEEDERKEEQTANEKHQMNPR